MGTKASEPAVFGADKARVLVADDSRITVSLISCLLDAAEYDVMRAYNGKDALRMASEELPDLALLDVMMPCMNGYEVCRSLQNEPATQDIPVIFMSIREEPESKVEGFEAGAVDYITKPVRKHEVEARVRRHLSLKFIRQTIKSQNAALERRISEQAAEMANMSATLDMLLEKKKEEEWLEKNLVSNTKELLLPYIDKLKTGGLDKEQKACVEIIESNLKDIVSPFARKLGSRYLNLTPGEIRVGDLVRKGKTNKEIANTLGISPGTVMAHRHNIRRKLGLKNRKINLRTYLLAFDPD